MGKIPQHEQKVKSITSNDFFLESGLDFCSFICSHASLTYLANLGGIRLKDGFVES